MLGVNRSWLADYIGTREDHADSCILQGEYAQSLWG
jgi:hypothetical protein